MEAVPFRRVRVACLECTGVGNVVYSAIKSLCIGEHNEGDDWKEGNENRM